jgi:hypothetical protein
LRQQSGDRDHALQERIDVGPDALDVAAHRMRDANSTKMTVSFSSGRPA